MMTSGNAGWVWGSGFLRRIQTSTAVKTQGCTVSTITQEQGIARKLRVVALLGGSVMVLLAPAVGYWAAILRTHFVANSDTLFLAELLPALATGSTFSDWAVPLANYALPDWPVYGIAVALGGPGASAVVLFMTLQLVLFSMGAYSVIRYFDPHAPRAYGVLALSVMVALSLTSPNPATYIALAYSHTGTVVMALASLGVALHWLGAPSPRLMVLGNGLTFLAVFSDRLFVIWFLVPAAVAIGVVWVADQLEPRHGLWWLGSNGLAAVVALPLPLWVFPHQSPYEVEYSIGGLPTRAADLLNMMQELLWANPVQAVLVAGFSLLLLGQLVRRRSLSGADLSPSGALFVLVFLAASVVSVVVGLASLSGGVRPDVRHYLVLFHYPLVLGPALAMTGASHRLVGTLIVPRVNRGSVAAAGAIMVVLVPMGFIGYRLVGAANDIDLARAPLPISCIEAAATELGSKHGIASYWDARQIEVFADQKVQVSSFAPPVVEFRVNAELAQYRQQYDFAVTSTVVPSFQLSLDEIVARAGQPATQTQCGPYTVSNWGPNQLDITPSAGLANRTEASD